MIKIEDHQTRYALVSVQAVENHRFDIACRAALELLYPFIETNKLLAHLDIHRVSICPQNPNDSKTVRYEPGFLVMDSLELIKQAIEKGKIPSLSIRTFSSGKWAKYVHVGSYFELATAWKAAFDEIRAMGLEVNNENAPYERYLDEECGDGSLPTLQTEIWIPIK